MTSPMRIAHFSDLHLLDLTDVGVHRFLNKRFVGYANLRLKRAHVHRAAYVGAIAREVRRLDVEHVVITGDLTNLALQAEFAMARDLVERDLGLDPSRVTIVPGNHDLYTHGSERKKRFAEYFGRYLESDLPDLAVSVPAGMFPVVKLRGGVAFIGLSSAVPRPPLMASGHLGQAQLDALARVLAHPEVAKRTAVVAVHHPVHNPASRLKARVEGLDEADALLAQLMKLDHALILHGHLHRRIQRVSATAKGKLFAVGATSASLDHEDDARMAGFNVYEIDGGGAIASVEAHVYEPSKDSFRIDSVPKLV
jgi:3',5'-cyclic AMP phosphodiesterase CpdA